VYLLWLAAQMLWSATRSPRRPVADSAGSGARTPVGVSAPGIPVQRAQPEGGAVLRHLPAPVPQHRQRFATLAGRAAVRRSSRASTWPGSALYITAVERLGRWLRRPRIKARIEQLTGLILATVAIRLATTTH
jgi:threonine/homoserine/homoserine lactone efflux protein